MYVCFFFDFLAERGDGGSRGGVYSKKEEYMRSALLDILYCIESVHNSLTKSNGYFGSVRLFGSSAKIAHSSKIVCVLCGLCFFNIYINLFKFEMFVTFLLFLFSIAC